MGISCRAICRPTPRNAVPTSACLDPNSLVGRRLQPGPNGQAATAQGGHRGRPAETPSVPNCTCAPTGLGAKLESSWPRPFVRRFRPTATFRPSNPSPFHLLLRHKNLYTIVPPGGSRRSWGLGMWKRFGDRRCPCSAIGTSVLLVAALANGGAVCSIAHLHSRNCLEDDVDDSSDQSLGCRSRHDMRPSNRQHLAASSLM